MDAEDIELIKTGEVFQIAFSVTDKFLSLGLFNPDGTYDLHRDLIVESESAIEWGKDLLGYYKERYTA